jgi:hypothetical protein
MLSNDDLIPLLNDSNLETKSYLISSYNDWDSFAKTCYVVWYRDGKDWKDPIAQNYTLIELAEEKKADPRFIRKLVPAHGISEFTSNIILTAYDPEAAKRLIVDGVRRSVILTNESINHRRIPNAIIYECQGKHVDRIFPADFAHLQC